MAATWQEIVAYFNGYTVGGEAIVRINKKHTSIGKMRNGVFCWTPAGLELSNTIVIPRTPAASSPSPRSRRPRKAAIQVTPNAEVED